MSTDSFTLGLRVGVFIAVGIIIVFALVVIFREWRERRREHRASVWVDTTWSPAELQILSDPEPEPEYAKIVPLTDVEDPEAFWHETQTWKENPA